MARRNTKVPRRAGPALRVLFDEAAAVQEQVAGAHRDAGRRLRDFVVYTARAKGQRELVQRPAKTTRSHAGAFADSNQRNNCARFAFDYGFAIDEADLEQLVMDRNVSGPAMNHQHGEV